MSNDIPEWALREFCDRAGLDYRLVFSNMGDVPLRAAAKAGGKLIAEHEEPPVDPLLIEAREIAATHAEKQDYKKDFIANIRSGNWDNDDEVQVPLAALKRGIKIGKGEQ